MSDPTAACQSSLSFTVSWSLFTLMSIELVMPSNHLVFLVPFSCLRSFPASGSFPVSQLFTSGGESIEASASVLPMNIQGWFPLGLISCISLLSKRLSRVFSSTMFENINYSLFSLLYGPTFTSIHDSFDYMDLCWHSNVSAFLMSCIGLS